MLSSIVSPLDGFRSPFGPPRGFNPARLFGPTDTGWLYDLPDMSTLFQDAAGTIPVTAVNQPVGLCLDKSKGLVRGPELVTNGDFSSGTAGWTLQTGWTIAGGMASVNSGASANVYLQQTLTGLVIGRTYQVSYSYNVVSGRVRLNPSLVGVTANRGAGSVGTDTVLVVATSNNHNVWVQAIDAGTVATIDNISVRELPGIHRSQSASLPRPTYARHPASGIRNLLTFTEEFENAAWAKSRSSISPNVATGPDGSLTADKLVEDTSSTDHRLSYGPSLTLPTGSPSTGSIYMKAGERNFFRFYVLFIPGAPNWTVNLTTGAVNIISGGEFVTVSTVNVGNGWWRISWTFTAQTATSSGAIYGSIATDAGGTINYTGDGTSGIFVWGAQLELGSTATAYQRVRSVFDVTEAGQPDLYYLSYDGSDDFLSTAPFAWGSDKATICAGVRKLSDAAGDRVIVEASANSDSTNGTFRLGTNAATFTWRSRGTVSADTSGAGAQPISAVLTGIGDISGDVARLRRTGVQVGEVLTDQGTGNFGTHSIFFGARAGTSSFFNGREYPSFGINRLLTANELSQLERWTAQKTGVTIP